MSGGRGCDPENLPGAHGWQADGPWRDVGDARAGWSSTLIQPIERPVIERMGRGRRGVETSSRDVVTLDTSAADATDARKMPPDDAPVHDGAVRLIDRADRL